MTTQQSTFHIRAFISYSHEDAGYKQRMETALAPLRESGGVQNWSDQRILAGQNLSSEIQEHMDNAHVFFFLLSPNFIASSYCMMEWNYAAKLAADGKAIFRIPIILRSCAWQDMMGDDAIKALPNDGKPISTFDDEDIGWTQVYEGIKAVIEHIRQTFTPKKDFLKEVNRSYFLFQSHLKLNDTFEFPYLTDQTAYVEERPNRNGTIRSLEELLATTHALIHGTQHSGKTTLLRHVFLSLVECNEPVILVDCEAIPDRSFDTVIKEEYSRQFSGDYELWRQQHGKTILIDNMVNVPRKLKFIADALDVFDRVYIGVSTDAYLAFFYDDARLARCTPLMIEPLTPNQQERLIRKHLELSDSHDDVTDGYVDLIETEVNAIIVSDRIFPRYPFYVLSIMQSHEAYMPSNFYITSYSYCYYGLILASLHHSGVPGTDDMIGSAFNFAEHLAYDIYQHTEYGDICDFDFEVFVTNYKDKYHIADTTINRLQDLSYGLINKQGCFRSRYVYYYFLAKYLARGTPETRKVLEQMCEYSHQEINHLTLLFTIHHTDDDSIINDILVRTMCSLDHISPATLSINETRRFASIIAAIPSNIINVGDVAQSREQERLFREEVAEMSDGLSNINVKNLEEPGNSIYQILKNNKIISQVLRNKHGRLEKSKIEEVVAIVIDSNLRLINIILDDEERVNRFAEFIHEKHAEWSVAQIKTTLEYALFIWTISIIEDAVNAINIRAIKSSVDSVVINGNTPAHDLVGYFNQLSIATELTTTEQSRLRELLKTHDDMFIHWILAMRTKYYMNTRRSPAPIEQSMYSILGIKHKDWHHPPGTNR